MEAVAFYILAVLGLLSAAAAVSRRDPLMSVVWFACTAIFAAVILMLLHATLVAVAFVIVTVSSSMVLGLFVVMLTDPAKRSRTRQLKFGKVLAFVAAGYLAIVVTIAVAAPPFMAAPASGEHFESPLTIGRIMISQYVLPFEMTGVMLLISAIAAILMAKKEEGA